MNQNRTVFPAIETERTVLLSNLTDDLLTESYCGLYFAGEVGVEGRGGGVFEE